MGLLQTVIVGVLLAFSAWGLIDGLLVKDWRLATMRALLGLTLLGLALVIGGFVPLAKVGG